MTARLSTIVAVLLVGTWMVFTTWRVEHAITVAETSCDFAVAAAFRAGEKVNAHPRQCPRTTAVFIDKIPVRDPALPLQSNPERDGYIPNRETAIAVARAILTPIYDPELLKREEPLVAELKGDAWLVHGTLCPSPDACPGGTIELALSRSSGRILSLSHGE